MQMVFAIIGDATSLVTAAGSAETSLTSLEATGARTSNTLSTAFGAAAVAGIAALGAGLASTITTAANFEQQISAISAVAGAGTTSIEALRAKALELGRDTSFSASEAAAGMEEMVKAGLSIADVMNGGARAALDLAAAGGLSVAEAATVASNAMNAFGLSGDKMAHIADALAGASVASATDVHELGYAMASVGAVANTVGLSFDDTTTAISLLAQAGLKGSDSGTSLKTMLLNLNPSSKSAAAEMRTLGIITEDGSNKFFDAAGNVKSMSEVAQVLQDSMAGLTKEQQINALQTAFGTDAIRAAAIMAKAGAAGFNEMTAAEAAAGGAQKIAAERLNNFLGSMEKLKGSVETASIMIGSLFLPALKDIADQLTDLVNDALPMIEALPDAWRTVGQVFQNDWSPDESLGPFINAVGNAAISVHGMVDAVLGLPEPVKAAGLAFAAVMVAAGPLSTVLGLLPELFGLLIAPIAAVATPLGALALGVAALAAAWDLNLGDIQGKTADFMAIVGPAFQGLGGIISTAVSGDIAGAFGQFLTLVTTTGQQLGPLLATWGAEFVAWVPGAITALTTTLTAQVALIPWGPIWAAATTAATSLATFLGTLVVDFSTWLTAQVALIPWATIWTAAKTATTALATFLGTQVVDFATWLTAQAAKIPWATVWGGIKDAATALSTFVATQAVDFATWLGAEAGKIPWGTVWTSVKGAGTALGTFLVTQVVDFATWLGQQVAAIPWATVWQSVTGLDTSMQATFVTAGGTMDWGAVITANAQMAADMTTALGAKFEAAITGINWTVSGQNIGKGLVDAIAVAFGLAEVSDAWATGFGAAIVRAAPKMLDALVKVLAGVFEGALAEAWNLAIASWVPGTPTLGPPNPGAAPGTGGGGWTVQWPGQGVAPGVQGPPVPPGATPPAATGTYVPPSQQPQGPVQGPQPPAGFTPPDLTPQPPAVAPAAPVSPTGQYGPIDNSSRASFARTAWPIFLDAAHGDANLAQMMIAAAISENGTVGSGSDIGAGNNFYGIKAPGPSTATGSFTSSTWEQGQGTISDSFASFPDPVTGANGFMQFLQENPRYAPALAAYQKSGDADQLFQDINAAGYATNPNWGSSISNIRRNQVAPNVPTAMPQGQPPAAPVTVPQINQFSPAFSSTLSPSEAAAACGPAALAWFMTEYGQTPTPQQALDLAKSAGWDASTGMYGPGAFSNALTSAGIPNTLNMNPTPTDVGAAAASGQPFALSTAGHYYQVQGGDVNGLNVGGSGIAAGGSSVMSLDQITRLSGAVNGLITADNALVPAADVANTSVQTMGTSADTSTQSLSAIGASIDPVVAGMDEGAVSVGGMTDAIIASAAQQGVATQSASDYSAGLTDQTTALEGVLAGYSATTPAAADLLTQLQSGAITTDQAAVSFAGLATTTATATGAIGDASDTMLNKVGPDFTTMADGATVATDTMGTDVSAAAGTMSTDVGTAVDGMVGAVTTLADGMQTSVSTSADTMDTDASTSAGAMQGTVGDAVDGMVGAVTQLADGMQTSVSTSADTMDTNATGSAQGMQGTVGDAVDGMVGAVVTLADGMNTAVSGSTDDMNTSASGSADAMNTSVSGSAQDMSDTVGTALGDLTQPLADTATGMDGVGTSADGATQPVGDFAGSVTDAGSAAGDAAGPVQDFADATAIKPPSLKPFISDLGAVQKAAQKAAEEVGNLLDSKGAFGSIKGKASGGAVFHDTAYIVGEQGPELFVPAASGVIVPNHRLRGLATGGFVSVDGAGPAQQAPNISTDPVPVIVDPDALGILQGIQDRADQLIAKDDALADILHILDDRLDVLTSHEDVNASTTQVAISGVHDVVANLPTAMISAANPIAARLGDVVTAIGELGKVEATGVTLLQGLVTALTHTTSTTTTRTGTTTTPAAVTAAPSSATGGNTAAGGKPTAPLPAGYSYKEFSPGVWGVVAGGLSVPAGSPTTPVPTDIGTGHGMGPPVAEPGISPHPVAGAPPPQHGQGVVSGSQPGVNESGIVTPPGAAHGQEPFAGGAVTQPEGPGTVPHGPGGAEVTPGLASRQPEPAAILYGLPPDAQSGGVSHAADVLAEAVAGTVAHYAEGAVQAAATGSAEHGQGVVSGGAVSQVEGPALGGKPTGTLPAGWSYVQSSPGIFTIQPTGFGSVPLGPQPTPAAPVPNDIGTGRPASGFVAEPRISPPSYSTGVQAGQGVTSGQTAVPSHTSDSVTAPLTAASTASKALATAVTTNTTAMQTAATTQAKNMADHVGKSSDLMRNDVGVDVTQMNKDTTGDIGTMADDATTSADNMRGGVTDAAGTMNTDTVGVAGRMRDGVKTAADLMRDGANGAANLMRDGVVGAASDMYTKAAGSGSWIDKLRGDSIGLASKMNTGVLVSATALSDNLNKAPTGALYDVYSRGIGHMDKLRNDSIDLIGGSSSDRMVNGITSAAISLDTAVNGSKGGLYLTYSHGVTHLDNLRDQGISLANRAATGGGAGDGDGIVGAFGKIQAGADAAISGDSNNDGIADIAPALDALHNKRADFSAIVNEIGKITTAADAATTAIKKIPTSPSGGSSKSDAFDVLSGIDLSPSQRIVFDIDYARLAAEIVKANSSQPAANHQVNLSLTLEAQTADYEIIEAQAGSAT